MTLSIPTPVGGTFAVVIKDSGGTTVYSDTHGNEDFDPAITTAGDYQMYIDGDDTPVWCFTVSVCECPELISVSVSEVSGTYYGTFVFDFPDGFGCPFDIYVETAFASGTFTINSLSDLTLQTGTIYYREFLIGGVGELTWNVKLQDGTLCDSGYIGPEGCSGPLLENLGAAPFDFLFATALAVGPVWKIIYNTVAASCSGGTCSTADINYIQINAGIVGAPDSGTILSHAICASDNFTISPNISYPGYNPATNSGKPRYAVTVTTCCGAVYSDETRTTTDP